MLFLTLQITCSAVGQMLDLVLKQEDFLIDSTHGKKKKKTSKHQISDQHYDVIQCGRPLSFLSSLLDILQLKKDIENRFIV